MTDSLRVFDSAFAAVQCAIAIQSSLAAEGTEPSDGFRVQAKVGVGAGEPVLDGDDLFGSTINLTSRVCDLAQPGQILASRVVSDLCMGKGEPPWVRWRLLTLETRMELCHERRHRGSRRRVGSRMRRRIRRSGCCGSA